MAFVNVPPIAAQPWFPPRRRHAQKPRSVQRFNYGTRGTPTTEVFEAVEGLSRKDQLGQIGSARRIHRRNCCAHGCGRSRGRNRKRTVGRSRPCYDGRSSLTRPPSSGAGKCLAAVCAASALLNQRRPQLANCGGFAGSAAL